MIELFILYCSIYYLIFRSMIEGEINPYKLAAAGASAFLTICLMLFANIAQVAADWLVAWMVASGLVI